jgi:hypothetical protein
MEAVGRLFAFAVMVSRFVAPTTLLAQDRTSAGIKTRMGVVVSRNIQALEVKTFEGTVLATLALGAKVWKASISPGKSAGPDFSAIVPGDRVLMRGIQGPSGKFVADEVWANLVSFHGVVIDVKGRQYAVRVDKSGIVRTVQIDPATLGEAAAPLSPDELRAGRPVQTIGLELPDGTIQATRVIPDRYINDIPPGERITEPNGRPNQR